MLLENKIGLRVYYGTTIIVIIEFVYHCLGYTDDGWREYSQMKFDGYLAVTLAGLKSVCNF